MNVPGGFAPKSSWPVRFGFAARGVVFVENGIHVVYGVPGLKVHAKIALIVRREIGAVRRYAYIGTGNLNAATASSRASAWSRSGAWS